MNEKKKNMHNVQQYKNKSYTIKYDDVMLMLSQLKHKRLN